MSKCENKSWGGGPFSFSVCISIQSLGGLGGGEHLHLDSLR